MTKRLQIILSNLDKCITFADVGCDHGYISQAMLQSEKCKNVIISDISKPSLSKAISLLNAHFANSYKAVVCDGIPNVDEEIEQVLIAGMGGEEIIKILNNSKNLPNKLLVQPMKNTDKVRATLIDKGYKIVCDYKFKDNKFYDIIKCQKGKDSYTSKQLIFGRDNLNNPNRDFKEYINLEIQNLNKLLQNQQLTNQVTTQIESKIKLYTEVENDFTTNF